MIDSVSQSQRVRWMPVALFIVISYALAWLIVLPLWLGDGLASPFASVFISLMMFTPVIAAVIVMFAFRAPANGRALFLGIWPLRPVGRFLLMLAVALAGPIVIVIAATALASAFGWVQLDLIDFSGFAATLAATVPEGTPLPPVQLLVLTQVLALPLGAIVNVVFAAGEEIGWRGWLQSALLPLGIWPAMLITGVIWGLWHAPVILLGYNFGRPDIWGLLLMVAGTVAWGVFFGWLRMRSRSVWPAALAHGSLNAVGAFVLLVAAAGVTPDMALVGPLGAAAWIVLAVVVAVLAAFGQFRRDKLIQPAVHPS